MEKDRIGKIYVKTSLQAKLGMRQLRFQTSLCPMKTKMLIYFGYFREKKEDKRKEEHIPCRMDMLNLISWIIFSQTSTVLRQVMV